MELLATVSDALHATPLLAGAVAFVWGLMSIWFSPCHLAGIPLIVAYLADGAAPPRKPTGIILGFALGALAGLLPLAAITLAMGHVLGDLGGWSAYLVATVCIVAGLYLFDVLPLPDWGRRLPTPSQRGPRVAFGLGTAFGFTLGPCAFAWLAPVLGAAWLGSTDGLLRPVLLLTLFAAGHCAGVWLAADSLDRVQRWLDRFEHPSDLRYGRFACGGLLLVGGGYLLAAA